MSSISARRRLVHRPALRRRKMSMTAVALLGLLALTSLRLAVAYLAVTLTVLAIAAAATGLVYGARWRRRRTLRARDLHGLHAADPHSMGPDEFEHFLADLCRRDGCTDVTVQGGAGDLAADVLYTDPHGRRGLIQAKRYAPTTTVGSPDVQMVNGTYRYHRCVHASIVTTSGFTRAAREFGGHVGIALVDSPRLQAWITGQRNAAPWN